MIDIISIFTINYLKLLESKDLLWYLIHASLGFQIHASVLHLARGPLG